ncbi:MAG: flagellar basal body P-ring formation chaperone FlgA [Enterobacterales bacterium]|nr:flagellar basal body P-ring formation chaperone FlgA [Enterobacterales bacterium]
MRFLKLFRNSLIQKRLVCSLLLLGSYNIAAEPLENTIQQRFQNNQQILRSAKIFLEESTAAADNSAIEIIIGKLDPRLKLRRCDLGLDVRRLNSEKRIGKTTLIVSCPAPVAWKVFVSAKVLAYEDVVIAKRNINRRAIITAQDVAIKRVEVSHLRKRPITELSHVIGTSAKRRIRRDSVVFEYLSCLICKGDSVQITAQNRFFNINVEAIALADASIGETTLVRNAKSKRVFNAVVTGKNQLKVKL